MMVAAMVAMKMISTPFNNACLCAAPSRDTRARVSKGTLPSCFHKNEHLTRRRLFQTRGGLITVFWPRGPGADDWGVVCGCVCGCGVVRGFEMIGGPWRPGVIGARGGSGALGACTRCICPVLENRTPPSQLVHIDPEICEAGCGAGVPQTSFAMVAS